MDAKSREMIRVIKSKIIAMLDERHRLQSESKDLASPSNYWSDFCSFFDYMLGLPEESFSKLRLHTYHLTGDNYQIYYFDTGAYAETLRAIRQPLIAGIPCEYLLYEPEGGIGFPCRNGKIVSQDVLRFQQVVSTLYRYGIISSIANVGIQRKLLLDIGSGYGGLAHHLSNILGNPTCILVDLPETLLFSASYLSLLNPHKRTYVYGPSDFAESVRPDVITSFDFVLVPNYKLDELRHLRFDLALNVSSLQEMRTDQVNRYLDFIAQTCRGVFYSLNEDRHPKNAELGNLSEMLRARFELTEVLTTARPERLRKRMRLKLRQVLKRVAMAAGLWDRPEPHRPIREYICKPLRNMAGGR
jgi:hypothetical protein